MRLPVDSRGVKESIGVRTFERHESIEQCDPREETVDVDPREEDVVSEREFESGDATFGKIRREEVLKTPSPSVKVEVLANGKSAICTSTKGCK